LLEKYCGHILQAAERKRRQPMRIAIIGTRGIPNNYGGFEQLAAFLSGGLVSKGCSVTVYSPHTHPYKEKMYKGVSIVHCKDGKSWMGSAGQFVYDFNCIRHARRQQYDVVLFLGYTSSSVWWWLYPKKAVIVYNMDGMEWQRGKYGWLTKRFLQYAEGMAVRHSDYFIADSPAIANYLQQKYDITTRYIPYGAEVVSGGDDTVLAEYGLVKGGYCMLLARMEPENNIAMVLEGFCRSKTTMKLLVTGSTANAYGKKMVRQFGQDGRIIFTGPLYNAAKLHSLRSNCCWYFHGHSVGGTNPSLLEAMADRAFIAAHDNAFNRAVLNDDAYYFSTARVVWLLLQMDIATAERQTKTAANFLKIQQQYNWPAVIDSYYHFFKDITTGDGGNK
jgi:glycosyltransferase involved in cell wall biosynthesis